MLPFWWFLIFFYWENIGTTLQLVNGIELQVLGTLNVNLVDSSAWVSWEGGFISAGKGSVAGQQAAFSHSIRFLPHHVYVTGKEAKWYFFRGKVCGLRETVFHLSVSPLCLGAMVMWALFIFWICDASNGKGFKPVFRTSQTSIDRTCIMVQSDIQGAKPQQCNASVWETTVENKFSNFWTFSDFSLLSN